MDRVLEIGGFAAGFCGRLFVQAEYEVVRVEFGESSPGWVSSTALDLYLHPGKRRVRTANLDLVAELAARADVVIAEAHTADGIAALGFDGQFIYVIPSLELVVVRNGHYDKDIGPPIADPTLFLRYPNGGLTPGAGTLPPDSWSHAQFLGPILDSIVD